MKILQSKVGIYFKLESADFKSDWGSFLREIKKLRSAIYEPAEMDESNYWFIGTADQKLFLAFKELFIDRILRDTDNYKKIGYKPIPRSGGRFSKRKLKY